MDYISSTLIGTFIIGGIFTLLFIVARRGAARATVTAPQTRIRILYGSRTGHAKSFSELFSASCTSLGIDHALKNIQDEDPEQLQHSKEPVVYIIFISTYEQNTPPPTATWFHTWLEDAANDFRVSRDALSHIGYAIFGLGDSAYGSEGFNAVALNMDRWFESLSARRLFSVGPGDQQQDRHSILYSWSEPVLQSLQTFLSQASLDSIPHQPISMSTDSTVLFESSEDESPPSSYEEELLDLEDLGRLRRLEDPKPDASAQSEIPSLKNRSRFDRFKKPPIITEKPMVTPELHQALTKQGYRILGSHSGVKLCRWTKSMLRNRGGCYKHTFYGIESHRCMETTPSLACANKCVFCWRHNTNPVGTQWKWQVDPPEMLVKSALDNHYQMVKAMHGIPGADPKKIQEASKVRHCALSLVGEPILYPYINDLITMLHQRGISTFLVTNAQFPDLIDTLAPVTQLYISVDAPTKDSLKRIDRPLFSDYWERFLASMKALSLKKQRTVYRLTLVKGYNVECIEEYAKLIRMGAPDFVEVKGVTYCGNGPMTTPQDAPAALRMSNVPFHHEVIDFCRLLCEQLDRMEDGQTRLEYGLACEHAHSCCVLISHKRFLYADSGSTPTWHTWIDYDRFLELQERYIKEGAVFDALEYAAETPYWALAGSEPHGFDPKETRHYRKKVVKADQDKCECKESCRNEESTAVVDHEYIENQGC